MTALAIFSIGIVGTLQMSIHASAQNGMASRESVASKLGRDLVESFERLPFDHAYFATVTTTPLTPASEDFTDLTIEPATLRTFTPDTPAGERPLLGAAAAIFTSDGEGTRYEVFWRVSNDAAGITDAAGIFHPQAKRIAVMVRYRNTVGPARQLNFYTVKFNPIVLGGVNLQEI
jgi:type IV pilus assembly protein PilV